jgi:hypothetical protein
MIALMGHWYPRTFPARIPWHANFDANAQATGPTYGLSAADLADIGRDRHNVAEVVRFKEAVDAYRQAVTEWAGVVLDGGAGAPMPPLPTAPPPPSLAPGSKAAIRSRARLYARIIKAAAGYTRTVGESFGIVAPVGKPGEVEIASLEALAASQVRVRAHMAGHKALALDSRRGGGAWEHLLIMTGATFTDARPPLQGGQPEVREYRCQAYAGNRRQGPVSPVKSVVTAP